ncbi:hypothetical protein L4C33_04115 [Vibrio makurazakiensis]|uniref:hypothetical protein n=1 Tax=Vibrio makurazakiensis TaxID=2910250 RepID=UPI003D0BC992
MLIRWLVLMCVLTSTSAFSANDRTTIQFRKHVQERCGIEVLESAGELSLGHRYDGQTIRFKLTSNKKNGRLLFKLAHFDLGNLFGDVEESQVSFLLESPIRHEGNVDFWRQGVEIHSSLLRDASEVTISARINVPEHRIPAGNIYINMEWGMECL